MRSPRLPLSIASLSLIAAIALACDSFAPAPTSKNNPGIPHLITISPAAANAQDYSGGKVPFVATGYFQTPPSPVSPLQATWGVCFQQAPTSDVSISDIGVAQCGAGASGTYSVFASRMTTCGAITACGGGCQVSGYATLTCP
jgi:hypothetical protein